MRFIDYLKYKKRTIAAFFICAAFIISCQLLYRAPMGLVWYPLLLCALTVLIFLIAGYRRHRRTYKELEVIRSLQAELIGELPEPLDPQDVQYQQIIRSICDRETQRLAHLTQRSGDMLDYYTAWAHQIKTPIAAMKLNLQNEDSALARQSLNDLKRIEQYVDMVLTYLKLDSGDIDYVIRAHNLDDILRQAVKSFAGEFISRGIRLEYEPVNYKVLTDDKWLTFVIEQILSNALKYTDEGGTIRITMEGSTLCISDTGIGIEAADIPRIFEKGFTGYNGRADKRASGIGLYLCRRICDNLSHGISATSVVGEGTTIRIDLAQNPIGIE